MKVMLTTISVRKVLTLVPLLLAGELFSSNHKNHVVLQKDFETVHSKNVLLENKVRQQREAIEHLKKFSEETQTYLEDHSHSLSKANHEMKRNAREKSVTISNLLNEVSTLRTRLHEVMNTRENLEKAYNKIYTTLQTSKEHFESSLHNVNDQLAMEQVAHINTAIGEQYALHEVTQLKQALEETNQFYSGEVNHVFDEMNRELEQTKSELNLSVAAYNEVSDELATVQQQLEAAQKLLEQGGTFASSERELKELRKTLHELNKATANSSNHSRTNLLKALRDINNLNQRLELTANDLATKQKELAQSQNLNTKQKRSIAQLVNRTKRMKQEFRKSLSNMHQEFQKHVGIVQAELATNHKQVASLQNKLDGQSNAFKSLEQALNDRSLELKQEVLANRELKKTLTKTEHQLAVAKNQQKRLVNTHQRLVENLNTAHEQLALETNSRKELGLKLRETSSKLAHAELTIEKLGSDQSHYQRLSHDLKSQLIAQQGELKQLHAQASQHELDYQRLTSNMNQIEREKELLANRYSSLQKSLNSSKAITNI
jgi:chromosome segregation ATPase